jgi:hypothetical protein
MITSYWAGQESDAVELKIISDAHTLAKLAADNSPGDRNQLEKMIATGLKSAAGKEKARSLLQAKNA